MCHSTVLLSHNFPPKSQLHTHTPLDSKGDTHRSIILVSRGVTNETPRPAPPPTPGATPPRNTAAGPRTPPSPGPRTPIREQTAPQTPPGRRTPSAPPGSCPCPLRRSLGRKRQSCEWREGRKRSTCDQSEQYSFGQRTLQPPLAHLPSPPFRVSSSRSSPLTP